MTTRTSAEALTSAITKSRMRLLPFLILMYVLAFIDRANVGYARSYLQADTGLSDAAFAFGASIFFIGYAFFEVPSNLMLHRLGAKVWLCRIMVTWGLVSAAMMFADSAMTFYVLRFLLGVAEAGFFPGIILYLTYWFPARSRGQALGMFYFGLPLALVLGGPLSGWLLEYHGVFGLTNWQWLFVVEGLLASIVGVAAYFYLVNRPGDARWLNDEEKAALETTLAEEDAQKQTHSPHGFLSALRNGRVLRFCLVYFTIQMSVYGVVFYLPTRIASFLDGSVGLSVGLITAIPWLCALLVTRLVTLYADRTGQHRRLAVCMLAMAACGIAASALGSSLVPVVIAFCFAAAGFVAVQPLFWTIPTSYLSGAAAASGIALINSLGNLGGFVAPNLKTFMESQFGDPRAGMLALAVVAVIGALMIHRLNRPSTTPAAPLETARV
ncbi:MULTISPECIES: MFS transporter [Pseudomonas]|uniref:MFS transporter n=2 Tax=Pseudomonadaceae TaxID=135621 RepID=A0A0D0KKX6_9PSED|nr:MULTISPECIES: MFS transporter [Pseudomonas]KIP98690.1 MFS transporter [Pseudomonas fulva]MCW2294035.1 sugar phosphate permease [Pseudomonas sp. BIGb0408]NYH71395.1 sugar phosphate permease [Pseudomonas flavescens]